MQDSTIKTAFQETTIEADTWASESVGKFYGFPCPLVHIQNPKAMQTCICDLLPVPLGARRNLGDDPQPRD